MLIKILGFSFIALGLWGIIYITINRKSPQVHLFGLSRSSYEVTDSSGLNRLLIIKGYTLALFIILIGIVTIKTQAFAYLLLVGVANPLNWIFTHISKKKHIRLL